ncbi:putative fibronectin-like [Apostichopus japonicus]|uniref:Putative fibronectin-like n=1 Tax=Stichopus japonicus TaxID=307972 RepID=A0A2G8KHT2_STIJA|nr:putative fibronectin-like [Apostichopus japonicus]
MLVFDVSGLQADVAYDFGVYTYAGPIDQQIWSDLGPTDFVPIADVDGNVQIDSITSSRLNVLWDAYQNTMAYLITLVDENNQMVGVQQLDGAATQFSFTGLDHNTFYEARVEVFIDNQAFYAGDSNARTLPVGTPSGVVNVLSTTTDAITVDFTEIPEATSYQIHYTDNFGVTRTLTSFAGSPFTIPNLSDSTDYNIQVNIIVQGATELVGNAHGRTGECYTLVPLNLGSPVRPRDPT